MSRITIRIPTVQYGYFETEFEGTPEEAIEEHNRLIIKYNNSKKEEGLDSKTWNTTLDRYLGENQIDPNVWEKMNSEEKIIINEIKKSFARVANRQ